jgi:hypothetical protein
VTPSTFSGLRVVLFPHIARPLVLLEDIVYDVGPQFGIDLLGLLLVGSLHGGVLLFTVCKKVQATLGEYILREVR